MKTKLMTAVILAFFATAVARADIVFKGGAAGLMKAPAVDTGKAAPAMKCASCKSEFVTVKVPAFKATAPKTAIAERRACTSCGTKWVTTGHGKAKVDVAAHTCGECTM